FPHPIGDRRRALLPWWRGGVRGGGRSAIFPPPPSRLASLADLPHKGGGKKMRNLRHVSAQNRRQIRIDHRGIAAPDQLDQRRDFVTDRHLREAHLARERG